VGHWHEWNQIFWGWVFSLIKVKVPKELVPVISFTVFAVILVIGVNLSVRTGQKSVKWQNAIQIMRKVRIFAAGVLLYIAVVVGGVFLSGGILLSLDINLLINHNHVVRYGVFYGLAVFVVLSIAFPIVYLVYFCKERALVLIDSVLFLFMGGCLLIVPLLV